MVEFKMSHLKHILIVLNIILVIFSIIMISVGGVTLKEDFAVFLGSKYAPAPTIFIVVGILIFANAILGCYSAIKENYNMVMAYGLLMVVIFIITFAGGITGLVHRNKLETNSEKKFLDTAMIAIFIHPNPSNLKIYDDIQSAIQCCGIDGPGDYPAYGIQLRDSCFKNPHKADRTLILIGCLNRILEVMQKNFALIGGFGVTVAIIELLGCIFAWFLAAAIKKNNGETNALVN